MSEENRAISDVSLLDLTKGSSRVPSEIEHRDFCDDTPDESLASQPFVKFKDQQHKEVSRLLLLRGAIAITFTSLVGMFLLIFFQKANVDDLERVLLISGNAFTAAIAFYFRKRS